MTVGLGMTELKRSWLRYWTQDLRQTPGRLERSLRLALTSVLVLIVMMMLRIPYAAYGMYIILIVGYETPPLSLRTGIASLLSTACSLSIALIVVILTDNNPIARIVSLAAVTFVAGMITVATSLPALGPAVGLFFGVGIGFWENHAPADKLVKNSLCLSAAIATEIAGSIAVGYVFGSGSPADKLVEQLRTRYRALEQMLRAYASDLPIEQKRAAAEQVSRLAAQGNGRCSNCPTRSSMEVWLVAVFRLESMSRYRCLQNCWTAQQALDFSRTARSRNCNPVVRPSRGNAVISQMK
jgi:multidrug resistance protein MdtO